MTKITLLLCVFPFVACSSPSNPSNAPPPAVAPSGPTTALAATPVTTTPATASPLTVNDVLKQAPDSLVQIKGLYLGWNGPCAGKPPTRSAWQLADSSDPSAPCIYVDGPAVPGVLPNAPPPNLTVVVHGKLAIDGNLRYVKADTVEKQ